MIIELDGRNVWNLCYSFNLEIIRLYIYIYIVLQCINGVGSNPVWSNFITKLL